MTQPTITPPPESTNSSNWDLPDAMEIEGRARLSEALSLESSQVPPNLRRWLAGGTAILAGSILVAALIPVQNYVVASGELEPAGEIQKVQHLEGGVIRAVPVKEGQLVKRGDVLVQLDEGELGTRAEQTATRITNLTLEQRQLRQALGQTAMNSAVPTPTKPSPEVIRAFRDAQDARSKEITRQIRLANQRIATLQAKRREYLDEVALLKKQTEAYESLDKVGAIPHTTVLEAERRIASTETQLAELDGTIQEASITLAEMRAKMKLDIYEQLAKVTSEKAELQSVLRRESSEVERLQVRSPVDGIVKSFNVRVVGGVVAPGSVVAEVVPVGEQMMAFTRVAPKDIGNVTLGQKVELKVQAYDYARFGTISGRVESISAGTFQDEKTGEPYYKVRVQLDQLYAGKNKDQNLLVPGMTLTADILTDRTSLLWYLLSPIRRGFGDALHQ
ncbi:MAG: HlyD family type I secretion periplasmic adaptor subunit [Vulcanococcus sp.]|uniref:HlyD family type I secretion periplasmic adaptor subunit n=1 Tax=Vulcanococcus sp. TaxID=2856995 RepID=UPI0025FDD6A5|nr:HlyD family type I secretion periplasmic adaptor subunit [Vulcanococcus sp.]MBW0167724.1 HlyD family type I secretion periplasmic adaptor subunit [Vulcanococcus sp.]